MYFVAIVTFWQQNDNEPGGEKLRDTLLLNAENYAEAVAHIEAWYQDDLLCINYLEAMTNNQMLYLSEEAKNSIFSDSRNQEFW